VILFVSPESEHAYATSAEEFCDANADAIDEGICDEVRSLAVGECLRAGGGAAPYFIVLRLA
jgi:hypothetical protein